MFSATTYQSTARSVLFGLKHQRLAKPVQAGFVVTSWKRPWLSRTDGSPSF